MGFRPFRKMKRRRRRRELPLELEPRPVEAELQPLPSVPTVRQRPDQDWGPLTRLGTNVRLQARRGHRAAVVELQPGMYLVAEVPEEALRPQIGVLPLLAPLLMLAANRALKRRMKEQEHAVQEPEVIYEPPPPRQLPGPAPAPWLESEDLQTVVSGCACQKRRGR